jgi:hypothetical protein
MADPRTKGLIRSPIMTMLVTLASAEMSGERSSSRKPFFQA